MDPYINLMDRGTFVVRGDSLLLLRIFFSPSSLRVPCVRKRKTKREREREREEVYGPAGPYRAIARPDDRFPRGVFHGDPRRDVPRNVDFSSD